MQKICRLVLLCAVFLGAVSVFPLSAESKESELYYVHAQLLKIFPHSKGYYVIYRRTATQPAGEAFIPLEWFRPNKENKADISFVSTRVNPYVSFFIKDGKCAYVRIAAPLDVKSQVWGVLQAPRTYDEKFEGVESLPLAF